MKEIELAVVGDIAWNHDIAPIGEKTSLGGAAYYSTVGASYFSQNIGTVARVGSDFDLSLLDHRWVDIEGIKIIPGGKTCRFVAIQHPDNTRVFEAKRGVAGIVETNIFPDRYFSAQFIHLSTQLPQHALIWLDFLVNHNGVSVDSFEPFVEKFTKLTREMFRRANIIFTNEAEWTAIRNFGEEFTEKPLIIRRGKNGAVYKHKNEVITIPAPQVNAVETSGAGDILAGAFLAQRAKGVSIKEALLNAVNLASLSVTDFGVDHIFKKEHHHTRH